MVKPSDYTRERLPVIGLLGAPGSGKSTIARMFEHEQCEVIDADQLAREAARPSRHPRQTGRMVGGNIAPDGIIDRKAVGEIVFADPKQRRRLEGLVHPYVNRRREELHGQLLGDWPEPVMAIVEDCPLLLEAGLDRGCDALVFIDCPLEVRQERVKASRGWSPEQLAAREAAQMPLDTKRAKSDYTIDNVGDVGTIQSRVRDVLQCILQTFA